jgi:biopolymer transport protein ExbB
MISMQYLVHLANYSDGVLYVLAVLLLIELAVIIDRGLFLRASYRKGKAVIAKVASLGRLDREVLESVQQTCVNQPEQELLNAAVRNYELIDKHGGARGEAYENRLDEAIFLTISTLDRRLWMLDTIVTLAPLVGLFGTILGMFHAFNVLGAKGGDPTAVTGGVADALVATASGLFIAMIGLVSFNAFNNSIEKAVHHLESLKLLLLNRLDGAPVSTSASPVEKPKLKITAA